jgi:serine/threonine protein kinase
MFVRVNREGTDFSLSVSKCYELSFHEGIPSEGILALRAFLLNAVVRMTVATLPSLQKVSSNESELIRLNPKDLSLLVFKTGSIVYAHEISTASSVLKKVVSPVSFDRELEALRGMKDHANVAKLLGYDVPNQYLLIYPLGKGTLSAEWTYRSILRVGDLLRMFKELLSGLHHVHEHNLLHRDIRPENIIFCETALKLVLIDSDLPSRARLTNPTSFRALPNLPRRSTFDRNFRIVRPRHSSGIGRQIRLRCF